MVPALLAILGFQLAGEALARLAGLPIPGPVLGLIFMLAGVMLSPRLQALVRGPAETILRNMLLLFVPAGVGAAEHLVALGDNTFPMVLAVVVSTVLALAAGALTFTLVAKLTRNPPQGEEIRQ